MRSTKHSVEVIKHPLDLDEQLPLHEKGWVIQRVGWVVMLAVVVAGMLGLFGEGLLSSHKISANGTQVEYDRYFRYETEMRIRLQSGIHVSTLALPQDYLRNFRIVRFVPEPTDNHTNESEVVYDFHPASNRIVTIYLVPKEYGKISGTLKVNGTQQFPLSHFIYP